MKDTTDKPSMDAPADWSATLAPRGQRCGLAGGLLMGIAACAWLALRPVTD